MSDVYDAWIENEAKHILETMHDHASKGIFTSDMALFVIPSCGKIPGRLVLDRELPAGATDVVRFPAQGSRVNAVPYSHLRSLLWNACRSFPILPVE
jgi:hypothetical protein